MSVGIHGAARHGLALGLCGLGSVVAARALVLARVGVPTGIDGGNWLAFGTFDRPGLAYPPLIPDLFAGLVASAGPSMATVVAGALAAAAPALAVLVVLAWSGRAAIGALAALAVASASPIGDAAAWGGYPQLVAIGWATLAVVAAAAFLDGGGWLTLGALALTTAGAIATSHLEAVPLVGALAMLGAWGLAGSPRERIGRVVAVAVAAGVPLVALAPTYLSLFATLVGPGSSSDNTDAGAVLGAAWPVYAIVALAAPLGLALAVRRPVTLRLDRRSRSLLVGVASLIVAWCGAFAISRQGRLLYDLPVLVPLGLMAVEPLVVLWIPNERLRALTGAAAVAVVAVVAASGLAWFPTEVAQYQVLSRGSFAAFEWLAGQDDRLGGRILVADVKGAPVGWWAEGLMHRETLFASDLRWLRFPDERDRATLANRLLYASGFPAQSAVAAMDSAGIAAVVLPSSGAFGVPETLSPPGWTIVFHADGAVILRPRGPRP